MLHELKLDLPENLPSKTKDLFCFSFDFENLMKTIDYLHKYNLALFSQLQNFNKRMVILEGKLPEFNNVKTSVENHEKQLKEHQSIIDEDQTKIKELENIIENLNDKNPDKKPDKNNNIKKKKEVEFNEDIIKQYLENYVIGHNNKDIDTIKHHINVINEELKEMKTDYKKKNFELEKRISNIVVSDKIVETNANIIKDEIPSGDDDSFKIIMDQIEKNKKNFQDFLNIYNLSQDKLKQDIININKKIEDNHNNYKSMSKLFNDEIEFKKHYITHEDIKGITTNLDKLESRLNVCAIRSELDNMRSDINLKMQRIDASIKQLSDEEKKLNEKVEEENDININKNISNMISQVIKDEIKELDISQNKFYVELMKLQRQNAKELSKNNIDLSELKNLILSSQTQKELFSIKEEISKFQIEFKKYKNKLIDLVKIIGEAEKKDEKSEKSDKSNIESNLESKLKKSEETIQGKLEALTEYIELINNKLSSLEKKFNTNTKDIKNDLKYHLKADTLKVIEHFKLKLDSFTEKFENELKNKIDRMGLNAFESKFNSKLNMDLRDKLNKNDLKKNTFAINKKIDTLENKISKTLVDTIIDIQMDDVPLISKKSNKIFELCASCNRPIVDYAFNHTIDNFNMNKSPSFMKRRKSNLKSKLKSKISMKKLPDISK